MPNKEELDKKVKSKATKTTNKKSGTKNVVKEDTKKTNKVEKVSKSNNKGTKKTATSVKRNATKSTNKKTQTKKDITKKNDELKQVSDKKSSTKVSTKIKVEDSKKLNEKFEEKTNTNGKKVNEATVIEKIKNFIAKIVAMQEEASIEENKEKTNDKNDKKETKVAKITTKPDYLLEYYDLPYRYNETIVKILAQTPKKLFVYWDISDNDREKYIKAFGDDFFNKTYPVLLLYNEDKKYVREIAINDFANSWYIDIQDSNNKYIIQLGRKFKGTPEIVNVAKFNEEHIVLRTDYLPFADSNSLEVPNDHVLLETLPRFIKFRNVKTSQETIKDLKTFKDIFGNNFDVNEFYGNEYKEEVSEGMFDMANPSSRLSSSVFK